MAETYLGTASVETTSAPTIRVDGACLAGTLAGLSMSPASIQKIRVDALDLLSRVVAAYEKNVAPGEVGANGTAKASESIPDTPCTGLLYGRIQSGKTVAMIALVAAAIDNGFRVIVVLTSDNLKLVAQTTQRFAVLDGPIPVDALTKGWEADHRHIGRKLGTNGVVFVCSKNKTRLDNLIKFLEDIGAPNFPALVLDDEADQATLDMNVAKNSKAREKGKDLIDPTAIHDRVVMQLSPALRHHVFLQVTATPYALLLQSVGTKLRPSFVRLLEPGPEYTGGEHFFEESHINGPEPPLVFVPDTESQAIQEGAKDAPDGLRDAIAFFLVAAASQTLTDAERARGGQNFLCHTSQLKKQHRDLESIIRDYVDRVDEHVERRAGEGLDRLQRAYHALKTTFPGAPDWSVLLEQVARRLVGRRVLVVNAETDADIGKGLNFVIGGNILGRGVTIDNLLVTYYLRQPKTGQMDTMLQHARMYGYRRGLMHLTRVFLPRELAVRFHEIHRMEARLRSQLATADVGRPIAIRSVAGLKATRQGVLDPTYIDAFEPGDQIYPMWPDLQMAQRDYEEIEARIRKLVGDLSKSHTERIDYDEMLDLVELLPYDRSRVSSRWVPSALRVLLERHREECGGVAYLHTRTMERSTKSKEKGLGTGALHSKVRSQLKALDGPVICAFRDLGDRAIGEKPYWYPTLVLDRKMPKVILNTTPDD